jgi:hypothetical protein
MPALLEGEVNAPDQDLATAAQLLEAASSDEWKKRQ